MSRIAGIWFPDGRPGARDALHGTVGCLNAPGLAWVIRGTDAAPAVGYAHLLPLKGSPHSSSHASHPTSYRASHYASHYASHLAAAGPQLPLQSPDGTRMLTADARIDNREDLVRRLGLQRPPATAAGDATLIFAAYEAWGLDCPAYLIGDFAFALWDARRQCFFCARDPMGVRPFYYALRPEHYFCFASEVGVFREVDRALYRVNETMVGLYLAGRHTSEREQTFYRGVRRLPAAHAMTVRADGISQWSYWRPDPDGAPYPGSDAEAVEAFRDTFEEAVRCRLYGAGPAGCMLSGGLDSTSVACVARDVLARQEGLPLVTLSTIFPDLPAESRSLVDERPYMDAALQTGGFVPAWIRGDAVSPLHQVDRLLERLGQPHDIFGAYLSWEAFRHAQERGLNVLLDGLDGDTTVSHGLDYLTELLRVGDLRSFVREGEACCRRWGRPPAPFLRGRALSFLRDLGQAGRYGEMLRQARRLAGVPGVSPSRLFLQALAASVPPPVRRIRQWLRGGEAAGQLVINPAFARHIGLVEQVEQRAARHGTPEDRSLRHAHARQFTSGLWQTGMEVTDALSAEFQLDVRHPFFDRRLIELSVALPADLKLRDGWTRYVLREAMAGILPEPIRWRVGKADLSPNFNHRLFEADRQMLEEALWQQAAVIDPYLDIQALRVAYTRFVRARGNAPAEAMNLFTAVVLSRWLRRSETLV